MDSFARVFGQDPAVLTALMLDQDGGDPSALRGLAELCRQAGALHEAQQLYARLERLGPGDDRTRSLAAILAGCAPLPPPSPGTYWPTPFVRLFDFLPPDLHAEVLTITRAALPGFAASQVDSGYAKGIDRSRRASSVLADVEAYKVHLQTRLAAAIVDHDVPTTLGVSPSRLNRYDLQVTCHGDGDYFTAHTDTGEGGDSTRVVSFVYYFHTEPRGFSGGGLRLFDAVVDARRHLPDSFTRIEPLNNSVVFFPSTAPHEVERVDVASRSMIDGRFSVNGWILDAVK
jgi:SM-20-related protein